MRAFEYSWELIALTVGASGHRGERRFRLRVRTEHGEQVAELPAAELPGRIAELCRQLGLEEMTMTEDFDLTKLAAMKRKQLDELDRELADLAVRRKRIAREVRAVEKCAAMLDAVERPRQAPKAAKGPRDARHTAHDLVLAALPATLDELASQLDKPRAVIARCVGQLKKANRVVLIGDTVRVPAKRQAAA